MNAPFKVWAPLSDVPDCFVHFVPDRPPRLLFHRPTDYWYKPAPLPQAYWTGPVRDRALLGPAGRPGGLALGPEPYRPTVGEDFGWA
ncbi:proline dipeptidase, partial [mine drainage metagenome]